MPGKSIQVELREKPLFCVASPAQRRGPTTPIPRAVALAIPNLCLFSFSSKNRESCIFTFRAPPGPPPPGDVMSASDVRPNIPNSIRPRPGDIPAGLIGDPERLRAAVGPVGASYEIGPTLAGRWERWTARAAGCRLPGCQLPSVGGNTRTALWCCKRQWRDAPSRHAARAAAPPSPRPAPQAAQYDAPTPQGPTQPAAPNCPPAQHHHC